MATHEKCSCRKDPFFGALSAFSFPREFFVASESTGVVAVRNGLANATPGFGISAPLYDRANVDILRRPQGTFVDANSTGGAVLIQSQHPDFQGLNGYAGVHVATYTERHGQAAVHPSISAMAGSARSGPHGQLHGPLEDRAHQQGNRIHDEPDE